MFKTFNVRNVSDIQLVFYTLQYLHFGLKPVNFIMLLLTSPVARVQ